LDIVLNAHDMLARVRMTFLSAIAGL